MRIVALIILVLFSLSAAGQKRVKLKKADNWLGSVKDGKRFDRVIGNVIFVQNKTTIYCDSAHFYKSDNRIEAFGKIHITEGDSVDVTARNLTYDGDKRIAYLRNNVVFTKLATATLYTDNLNYDRPKNEARYFNGGKLVDSTNVLTSRKGYYNVQTNMASFKTNVVGTHPDYTLTSDTLQYNSRSKIIYFRDHTIVKDNKGGEAVYESGYYNTNQKLSALAQGQLESVEYRIKGNAYQIDENKKYYKAHGKVVMTSKEENMLIFGDDSFYDKQKGISKVYGNAYVAKIDDNLDTLFITADTLVSIENPDPKKKRLLAYRNVKIFKTDLQGVADSLAYLSADSIIHFYKDPVLWSDENQITADSIRILLIGKNIDKLITTGNSFVISEDSLKNYNQIKGRRMTAQFKGSMIRTVNVQGNGESIYYALQEKEVEAEGKRYKITYLTGMNKLICSNMRINFVDGRLVDVIAYVNPDASFIPPHELKEADKRLKGFVWKGDLRPHREDVVKSGQNEDQ